MKSLESRVDPAGRAGTAYADEEASPKRDEVALDERHAEKPKASEEIMIEEINIDGMCGVY